MKIRQGFISNSSSASFTCQISGGTESGMDLTLREAKMCKCENGHIFYKDYLIDPKSVYGKFRYDSIPEKHCPVCIKEYVTDN